MTVSATTQEDERMHAARAACIAEIDQLQVVTGTSVVDAIDDFCIGLRCTRAQMPATLRPLYEQAAATPNKLFSKDSVILEIRHAA